MANYLIHAVPSRMWYVKDYLIPSMVEQGINEDSIKIYCDEKHEGNLRSFINSCFQVGDDEGTWHLQDDVIISRKFKKITEAIDFGVVCGFKSLYDDVHARCGAAPIQEMWFSFPCIRIPNKIAKSCADWIHRFMIGNKVYKEFWKDGVNDDWFFRQYMFTYHKTDCVINLKPNIVDHIDYLIGGTVNSTGKKQLQVRSLYWTENDLVQELEGKLNVLGRQ